MRQVQPAILLINIYHILPSISLPRSSMVLVYLPTKLGHLWGFYVGKYTSTMDDLGIIVAYNQYITNMKCSPILSNTWIKTGNNNQYIPILSPRSSPSASGRKKLREICTSSWEICGEKFWVENAASTWTTSAYAG